MLTITMMLTTTAETTKVSDIIKIIIIVRIVIQRERSIETVTNILRHLKVLKGAIFIAPFLC